MSKRKLIRSVIATTVAGTMLLFSGLSGAEELAERLAIVAEVEHRMADEQARSEAMEAGLERSTLCATCHGADGNSKKSEYPNLASQNPSYIIEQMSKFKDGRRKNFVMETLVRSFTREDQINLALYFSSKPLKAVPEADPALAAMGEKKFNQVCVMCHGATGRGEEGYARLAGQRVEYVMNTLKRFRSNAKQGGSNTETKRSNPRMEQVAQFLTDEEIEGLAHYIALIK